MSDGMVSEMEKFFNGERDGPYGTNRKIEQLNISVTYCLPFFEGAYDIMLAEMDEEPDFDTWDEENKQRLAMSVGERLFEDQFDIDLTFGSQVTCRKNGHTYYVTVVY